MSRSIVLPDDVVKQAEILAREAGLSVDEFLAAQLRVQFRALEYMAKRANRSSPIRYEEGLGQVRSAEPKAGDLLDD